VHLPLAAGKKTKKNTLKVAATPMPQASILEFVKPALEKQGIQLKIVEVDDYNIPNRALSEKEVDANFFQHIPFMDEQIQQFGYKIQCYAKIELEPMGIYSDKIKSLKNLKDGSTIAIPNDPTNEYRALALLEKEGLLQLHTAKKMQATVSDITSNPKHLRFRAIDAALVPRSLKDVDIAVINTNYAMQAGLHPTEALALESKDSPYANIIAIRIGDEKDPKLEALKKVMLTDKVRTFILDTYRGAIIPILTECQETKP